MAERTRTRKFRAETQKLLDLMIHSVYANREVFLRELISNASDAIDKARFEALTDNSLSVDGQWRIELIPDGEAGTLTVRDNGIGMTDDEVIEQIGTIARSGSEAFAAAVEAQADADGEAAGDLIGRFGVGFYSAFMAADRIELWSQKHGADHSVYWSSEGGETYAIKRLPTRARGTTITLHLSPWARGETDDEEDGAGAGRPPMDFTDPAVLRAVVKEHSDYVAHPILLQETAEAEGEGEEDSDDQESTAEEQVLNSMQPPWLRPRDALSQEEHQEFYRHVSHGWDEPLTHVHIRAEGLHAYSALVYIPSRAPMDLFTREARRGLQLYVRRVLIDDEAEVLVPEYLRFLRGVVESPDLPLSLSREAVQEDRLIGVIRRHLTRRVLEELARLRDDERSRYEDFWQEMGPVLKEGFHTDPARHDELRGLLLARSTTEDGWTTLDEYVARMPEGQEAIWWLSGEDIDRLRGAPQLEAFGARGVEVLLLSDPADEIVMGILGEHDGHDLRSVARDEIDLSAVTTGADSPERVPTASEEAMAPFLATLQEALGDAVTDVKRSQRLTDSASCLVAGEGAVSPHLERMMRAMGHEVPAQPRVLEVNPGHPLLRTMLRRHLSDPYDPRLGEYAELLYDQALIAEGSPPRDAGAFARRVAQVMAHALEGAGSTVDAAPADAGGPEDGTAGGEDDGDGGDEPATRESAGEGGSAGSDGSDDAGDGGEAEPKG